MLAAQWSVLPIGDTVDDTCSLTMVRWNETNKNLNGCC